MSGGQAAAPVVARPGGGSWRRGDRTAKYVFLVPVIAYLLLLGIFPLLFSIYLVFSRWQGGVAGGITWVGLDNIQALIDSARFWNSLRVTLLFVALAAGFELIFGFVIALALQSNLRGRSFFRLIFALPMLLPPIAVAYTWKLLFDFNRGPLNHLLGLVGLDGVGWVQDYPLLSLVIVDVWQWTPFIALASLAALESLSGELYEAGVVDGASFWALLRDITLPLVRPYVVAVVLLRAIDAFKVFDTVYIITGGGPGTATELLTYYGYVAGFRTVNMGFTATLSWAMVIVMTVIFLVYLRVFRRIEEA